MATDKSDTTAIANNRLIDAVRRMKINDAERNDVVIDMKEADRARLELLAERLSDVFEAVPLDDDRFDFALSSGTQPRLWIDATAHVMMGRDRRMFRFVRDTRLGRVILGEGADVDKIADHVTDYIAERMLERERVLAGETISYRNEKVSNDAVMPQASQPSQRPAQLLPVGQIARRAEEPADRAATAKAKPTKTSAEPSIKRALSNLLWVLMGLALGGGALVYATGLLG